VEIRGKEMRKKGGLAQRLTHNCLADVKTKGGRKGAGDEKERHHCVEMSKKRNKKGKRGHLRAISTTREVR